MATRPAIIQSIFESAVHEINALEGRIVQAEDNADAMLWEQAEHVAMQLSKGMSQRSLAAQWINARTGRCYTQAHVSYVRQVVDKLAYQTPRPRFRDAYLTIAKAKPATLVEPEPFNWNLAIGDLRERVETMIGAWPSDAQAQAPQALRDLAEILEMEARRC